METIDKGKLGALMRHMRTNAGYATAQEFAEAISARTGFEISKETIYKFESGKRLPNLSAFVAAELICKGAVEDRMLKECLVDEIDIQELSKR